MPSTLPPPAAYLPDVEVLCSAFANCVEAIAGGHQSAAVSSSHGGWLVLVAAGPVRVAEICAALDAELPGSPVQAALQARVAELEAELAALRPTPPALPSAEELAQLIRDGRDALDAADIAAVLGT